MLEPKKIDELRNIYEAIISESLVGIDKNEKIGVALSSGIDSNSILYALIKLGYTNVHGVTFHRQNVLSTDFLVAKQTCKNLGVGFIEVIIPDKINLALIKHMIKTHKMKKKTYIECLYTMDYVWEEMRKNGIVHAFNGAISDAYFCINKKASMHFKKTLELNQQFRMSCFENVVFDDAGVPIQSNYPQGKYWVRMAAEHGVNMRMPFDDTRLFKYFWDLSWYDLNEPREKYPLWQLYPDMVSKSGKLGKHTNLQCGDSEIRPLFECLLADPSVNTRKRIRMMDVYRDMFDLWSDEVKISGKMSTFFEE